MKMDHYKSGRECLARNAIEEARAVFLQGISLGDAKCAYGMVALAATAGEDLAAPIAQLQQVFPQLQEAAESADPEACFMVARCYETGSCVAQDIPAAMKYYTRAAMKGHADAAFNLGCIYMNMGPGGETLGLDFFGRSAEAGCADAQFALGYYHETHGNRRAALKWYEKAAQSGQSAMVRKYHDYCQE